METFFKINIKNLFLQSQSKIKKKEKYNFHFFNSFITYCILFILIVF